MKPVPLLLVTGFLGAGKTAFLKRFAARFSAETRLYIVVNEFGREGVDGALLADSGGNVTEIAGGSIFCSCRMEHFETALEDAAAFFTPDEKNSAFCTALEREKNTEPAGKDRFENLIVVETSGFSDPSAIMEILSRERFSPIGYIGCLCLADAVFFEKVFNTARAVKRQLGMADAVLLNKSDLASAEQRARARELLAAHYPEIPVIETVYGELPPEFFACMNPDAMTVPAVRIEEFSIGIKTAAGENCRKNGFADFLNAVRVYAENRHAAGNRALLYAAGNRSFQAKDITQQKLSLLVSPLMSVFDFEKCVRMFIEDTYRVKGIIRLAEGVFLADCVGNRFSLVPHVPPSAESSGSGNSDYSTLTLLAGSGMNLRRAVSQAARWYPKYVRIADD